MINTKVLKVLLARMTDPVHTIADEQGLTEGRRAGGDVLEAKLRLRVLKMLGDVGVRLKNEAEVREWMKAQEREVNLGVQENLAKQLQNVAESLGVTPEDLKAARNERRRIERAQRKANGDCVECPKRKVRRAAPGSTRCDVCEEAHNARERTYREREKKQERENAGSPVGEENASGADNEAAPTTMQQTDGATASTQSGETEPSVDAPASTHQVEPQRSDTGARLPFLTRIKQ